MVFGIIFVWPLGWIMLYGVKSIHIRYFVYWLSLDYSWSSWAFNWNGLCDCHALPWLIGRSHHLIEMVSVTAMCSHDWLKDPIMWLKWCLWLPCAMCSHDWLIDPIMWLNWCMWLPCAPMIDWKIPSSDWNGVCDCHADLQSYKEHSIDPKKAVNFLQILKTLVEYVHTLNCTYVPQSTVDVNVGDSCLNFVQGLLTLALDASSLLTASCAWR